jgi:hypothetical protein
MKMVEVKWSGNRGPAQRIHDRLAQGSDKYPLKPDAETVTQQQTRTKIYYGSSQAPSVRGHGAGPDEVEAAIAARGGIRPR